MRVQDGFKPLPGVVVGKYLLAHGDSVERPIIIEHGSAENRTNFVQRCLSGLHDFAGDDIGIHYCHAQIGEEICNG